MKKALISFNMMMWIPRTFFLVVVVFTIVLITSIYSKAEIQTWQAESELIMQRIMFSPNGISYYDPLSNRVYPGIIDLNKFKTKTILEDSIFYGEENKRIGAKITIRNQADTILAEGIYNDIVYRRIAEAGPRDKGGVDVNTKKIYVLVKDNQNLFPALAEIIVVVSRS